MSSPTAAAADTVSAPALPRARRLFYDYLAHRSAESLSYGKLARDAERVLAETGDAPAEEQGALTSAKAFGLLVRPLLRMGVLGFRGSGTYGPNATVAIATPDDAHVVLFNAACARTLPDAEALAPGVYRVPRAQRPPGVPLAPFDLLKLLWGMPALDALVRDSGEFPQHGRGTPESSWEVLRGGWRAWGDYRHDRYREERVLLFRTSAEPGAPRVLRLDGALYRVPSPRANPAAYPLALLLDDVTSGRAPTMLAWTDEGIAVTSDYFPAELERALWLGSLLHAGTPVDGFGDSRTYVLPERTRLALRRILLCP